MRVGIYTNNHSVPDDIINSIKSAVKDSQIHVHAHEIKENVNENVAVQNSINSLVKDNEIIINMLSYKQSYSTEYRDISARYNIDIFKAENLLKFIRCYDLLPQLDLLSGALKENSSEVLIINAGEPVDIITLYLHKAYYIQSYGISRKTGVMVDSLLDRLNLNDYKGKVSYRLAGIENSLWLYEIIDDKNKDLYPEIREKVRDLHLNVKRNDLTRDPLRSLKFYGYYHSYDTVPENEDRVIGEILKALSDDKKTVYLNAVNNGSIYGLHNDACCELPFNFVNGKPVRAKVDLPLQCTLAMTDMASAVALAVKCLNTLDRDIFLRTVKSDPYLASILTLRELQGVAEDILAIEQEISGKLK